MPSFRACGSGTWTVAAMGRRLSCSMPTPGIQTVGRRTFRDSRRPDTESSHSIDEHSRQPGAPAQPSRTQITYAKLETIDLPVLLLPGDQDLQTPPWVMRAQAAHLKNMEFKIIPEGAHSLNWEQPEAFNDAVL